MQVMKRDPEVQAYYSQCLEELQEQLTSFLSSTQSPQLLGRDVAKQKAAVASAPSKIHQGATADDGTGPMASSQAMQNIPEDTILDEQEGMRGSSAEDSDTGDDMDLDETPPLPSDPSRYCPRHLKQKLPLETIIIFGDQQELFDEDVK